MQCLVNTSPSTCNRGGGRRRLPPPRDGLELRAGWGGVCLLPPVHTALLDSLDRHARRRAEGIATLSTLVGPPEQGLASLTEWTHRCGLSVVLARGDDARGMVSAWATALARERNLNSDAEAYVVLSQATGPRQELLFRGKTLHERRVLLDGLTPPRSDSATWELCRALLEAPAPTTPGDLPPAVRAAILLNPHTALQSLLALVPYGSAPMLHVQAGPSDFRTLRTAVSLCATAPALALVCVLTPESLAEHLRRKESRVQAMLREGRLDLPEPPPAPPAPAHLKLVTPALARLQEEGLPEPVLARYAEAAQAITRARREVEDRARSEQERFFFDLLEHLPSTRGLFELNARVDVGHGSRPLEVDLLCRELKLAVELDGHFHFRDDERFRRDRRKDLALQRAGYWVVRFLADDVVPRLEELLETLDTLIAARRQESSEQETPHEPR
jgi:very-short-patch-repair endonuclease